MAISQDRNSLLASSSSFLDVESLLYSGSQWEQLGVIFIQLWTKSLGKQYLEDFVST